MRKLILLITILLVSSCAIMRNSEHTEYFMGPKVLQVLNSNEALVIGDDFTVAKVITVEEVYYEGLKLYGRFILVDTYSYETVEHKIKVVPVYVRYSEYRKYSSR